MLATRGRADGPWRLARGMRGERPGRVRWGSAGRAAVVLGLLALAIAWPRLAPPPPRLPSDAGIPVAPAGRRRGARASGRNGSARRSGSGRAGRARAAGACRSGAARGAGVARGGAEAAARSGDGARSGGGRQRGADGGARSGRRASGSAAARRGSGRGAARRSRRRPARRRPRPPAPSAPATTADVPARRPRDDRVLLRARVSGGRATHGRSGERQRRLGRSGCEAAARGRELSLDRRSWPARGDDSWRLAGHGTRDPTPTQPPLTFAAPTEPPTATEPR